MTTTKETIETTAAELGITMKAEFVPLSKSRNAGEKHPTLNWKVTIQKDGRDVLTTDYSAGCGHCPSYKQRQTVDDARLVKWECENGKKARLMVSTDWIAGGAPILPDLADVLHSLVADADVLNSGGFEDWAAEFDYDPDSRKAEATYRACLDIALKLRNGIGEETLATLREALQDY